MTEIADTFVDLDHAQPLGLIIDELVSNAMKHAFPGDERGEIRVSLQPVGEDRLELVVSDNGIGLPEEIDVQETTSLGLHLVSLLAKRQLGGTLAVSREDGTTFTVQFKRTSGGE